MGIVLVACSTVGRRNARAYELRHVKQLHQILFSMHERYQIFYFTLYKFITLVSMQGLLFSCVFVFWKNNSSWLHKPLASHSSFLAMVRVQNWATQLNISSSSVEQTNAVSCAPSNGNVVCSKHNDRNTKWHRCPHAEATPPTCSSKVANVVAKSPMHSHNEQWPQWHVHW